MGFDSKKGHNHWHFEQFAQYRLLDSAKNLAVQSHKVGFCIAPTDPVDLAAADGSLAAVLPGLRRSVRLTDRPVGAGNDADRLGRHLFPGQSPGSPSTSPACPNGTYYIEVVANPEKVLHETDTSNDASLRKVILGGKRGHRTVRVPAYDGIDPEG